MCITTTALPRHLYTEKHTGKVRDMYFARHKQYGDISVLISTDRQSAFDRLLGAVPHKGQVLTASSVWWFEKTRHIVDNHLIAHPDPNVIIAHRCQVLPIEFVVRGYISGSTATSLWTQYKAGVRSYCGITFAEGLHKNQKLPQNIITPTTKQADHDRPIAPKDIVEQGWLSQSQWQYTRQKALALFAYGQKISLARGLILVDTKYEFGIDANGNIILVDEIHTPDSSRFWRADSYAERLRTGQEPENFDKEFFRLWFVENGDPYKDAPLPTPPKSLTDALSARYIQQYEMITANAFSAPQTADINARISDAVQTFLTN